MRFRSDNTVRFLSDAELAIVPSGLAAAITLSRLRFINRAHNPFAYNKILVRGYNIYWPNTPVDFSRESLRVQSVLIHELCHVWQYASGRLTALRYLTNPINWRYRYDFDPSLGFDDYPTEKQADLLQDWYLMNSGANPANYQGHPPRLEQINAVVPFVWTLKPLDSSRIA